MSDEEWATEEESGDSDMEVQESRKREPYNNVEGLKEKLDALAYRGTWLEQLAVTVPRSVLRTVAESSADDTGAATSDTAAPETSTSKASEEINVDDDFKREACFYRQAQAAVLEAIPRLEALGVSVQRPDDYFAEMVKSDDHMKRIREHLLNEQRSIEQREKAKKLREMKKFGKKVQQDVLAKRQQEKKKALDAVKAFRRDRSKRPDFLDGDDDFPVATQRENKPVHGPKSKKRQQKDKKFGFGGQKRHAKSNTAKSSADTAKFSLRHNSKLPAAVRKGKAKAARPGKSKRQQMKRRK